MVGPSPLFSVSPLYGRLLPVERKEPMVEKVEIKPLIHDVANKRTDDAGKFGMMEACALNTLNMFGTGPFITIPFLFAARQPFGPQWLIGYALAAFICLNDSLIWGELSALMPKSGGTYTYLRECFGRETFGRFMAWLFVWQFFLSAPLEIASGFVAMSQYLSYFTKVQDNLHHGIIGLCFCLVTCAVLFNNTAVAGKLSVFLWVGTVVAIVFVVVTGFAHFKAENLYLPPDAFQPASGFVLGLGMSARIGVYDFTGYFDICQMGEEVKNPKWTLPVSCVGTCVIVTFIYFLVYLAVSGCMPWETRDGVVGFTTLVASEADSANYIMSLFAERLWGHNFAVFFTVVVAFTIFGSCFALILGYAHVPYAAARDGFFLSWFGVEHPTRQGLPYRSLIVIGMLSALCCLLDLGLLIEGMITSRLLLQFIAQAVAVIVRRRSQPDVERTFKVPLYPLPNIICILGFLFVFVTTDNWIFFGGPPLLEICVLFILVGAISYFPWAFSQGHWPWKPEFETNELVASGLENRS